MRKALSQKIVKIILLGVTGVVLLLAGLLTLVYTPWFQDKMRTAVVQMMNRRPDTHFELRALRLGVPLRLDLGGLCWTVSGDTLVSADSLHACIRPLGFLTGRVDVSEAFLTRASYRMGDIDSATMIVLHADTVQLRPARVRLLPLKVEVEQGVLAGADVDLYINPNPPEQKPSEESSPLDIVVKNLELRRLQYRMSLLPTIDSLGVYIDRGSLNDASISLANQSVDVGSVVGAGLHAAYIVPDSLTIANTTVAPPSATASAPWTVRVSRVAFTGSSGLYTTRGVSPAPGLDFAYISVDDVSLAVDSFYNRATDVRLPLQVSGTERCGVTLEARGTLAIDSAALAFHGFDVSTASGSTVQFDGRLGSGDIAADPQLPVTLVGKARLAPADLGAMFPVASALLKPLGDDFINCSVDVSGTASSLDISQLALNINNRIDMQAHGHLDNVFDADNIGGDVALRGTVGDVHPWLRAIPSLAGVNVPRMRLDGALTMNQGNYDGRLRASTSGGDVAANGTLHGHGDEYKFGVATTHFPVDAIMPALGVGTVTASVDGRGKGFDFTHPGTQAEVKAAITAIEYQKVTYKDITADVTLSDGHAMLTGTSRNPGMEFDISGQADIAPNHYKVTAKIDAADLNLEQLGMSVTPANMATDLSVEAAFDTQLTDVAATLHINSLRYTTPESSRKLTDITAHLNSADSITNASLGNGDMYAYFSSPNGLMPLVDGFSGITPVIDRLIKTHSLDMTQVQQAIPHFDLDVEAGPNNALVDFMRGSDMNLRSLSLRAYNDSTFNMNARMLGFSTGKTRVDTLMVRMNQKGSRLNFNGAMRNRRGTFDAWAQADVSGFVDNNRAEISLKQRNIMGQCGFDLGASVQFEGDSLATLAFTNLNPVIGYYPWTVNKDNFISYNFRHRHADADLHMSGANSALAIYTENAGSHDADDHTDDEDLVVDIADVHLQDWLKINPFSPPVRGNVSANLRLNLREKSIDAQGLVQLADLYYGKQRVGDLSTNINLTTNSSGLIDADASLWINGHKSMVLSGALNDSTRLTPLNLDMRLMQFPLATANAFLPGVASLRGTLNGVLSVSGTPAEPVLNGAVAFDSTMVHVDMLGTDFSLPSDSLAIKNSVLKMHKFDILACNENPLSVNGTVDLSSMSAPTADLSLKGTNMLLVNSKRAPKGADVYGKAYVSADATVRGDLGIMRVDANVSLLSGTNVTYVLPDVESALQTQSNNNMVKFVNFTDSAAVAVADSITPPDEMALVLNAKLTIQNATEVNVDLSGTDRVQIKPQGAVNFSMSPLNPGRLTGRINIDGGFVRYTPPVMSQKTFDFNDGSYVAFTGDMMNPTLNIHAVDHVRANVTQSGQNSRLIYFDVELGVTGTLNNMDVAFNLATDDDATVANELATMSPSQRASTAMNLLITNIYSAGGTKADANLGGNALYSFLTSQLNTWAANTIKGVDLSFGISQYDNTRGGNTSQATQYSYQLSKNLFNDRFKIVVGGNYSSDANADENLEQNIVSDISFEYLLNKQGTMVIRVFRHTGYESILEGEITETGVGFIYRRKITRLADIFRLHRRRKAAVPDNDANSVISSSMQHNEK